eukprot:PhM_4_TR12236/c0_g1_i1/m.53027
MDTAQQQLPPPPDPEIDYQAMCSWFTDRMRGIDALAQPPRSTYPRALSELKITAPSAEPSALPTTSRRMYIPIYVPYCRETVSRVMTDIFNALVDTPTCVTYMRTIRADGMLLYVIVEFPDLAAAMRVFQTMSAKGCHPLFVPPAKSTTTPTLVAQEVLPVLSTGRGITPQHLEKLFRCAPGGNLADPTVLRGSEPGLFFLSFQHPALASALFLHNKKDTYELQRNLLLRFGVLVTCIETQDEVAMGVAAGGGVDSWGDVDLLDSAMNNTTGLYDDLEEENDRNNFSDFAKELLSGGSGGAAVITGDVADDELDEDAKEHLQSVAVVVPPPMTTMTTPIAAMPSVTAHHHHHQYHHHMSNAAPPHVLCGSELEVSTTAHEVIAIVRRYCPDPARFPVTSDFLAVVVQLIQRVQPSFTAVVSVPDVAAFFLKVFEGVSRSTDAAEEQLGVDRAIVDALRPYLPYMCEDATAARCLVQPLCQLKTKLGEITCEAFAQCIVTASHHSAFPALSAVLKRMIYTLPLGNKKVIGSVFADHVWSFFTTAESAMDDFRLAVEANAVDVSQVVSTLLPHLSEVCGSDAGSRIVVILLGRSPKGDELLWKEIQSNVKAFITSLSGTYVVRRVIDVFLSSAGSGGMKKVLDDLEAIAATSSSSINNDDKSARHATELIAAINNYSSTTAAKTDTSTTTSATSAGAAPTRGKFRMLPKVSAAAAAQAAAPPPKIATVTPNLHIVHQAKGPFSEYPPVGVPFPPLPNPTTDRYELCPSLTHYKFFTSEEPAGTYQHPTTQKLFRVAPQQFVLATGLSPDAFVSKYKMPCTVDELATWLSDQRLRSDAIEHAVRRALKLPSEIELARQLCSVTTTKKRSRSSSPNHHH